MEKLLMSHIEYNIIIVINIDRYIILLSLLINTLKIKWNNINNMYSSS